MCKNCKDDGEHEFVGMDLCLYCNEVKQLLLQPNFFRSGDEMIPKKGIRKTQITSPEPCDKCKEKFKKQGIVPMIEAERGEHGPIFGKRYVFIKRKAVKEKEFKDFMNKHGFLICEPEVMDMIVKESNEVAN